MKKIVYNTISEKYEEKGFPKPENPLFNVVRVKMKKDEIGTCESNDNFEPVSVTHNFYVISLKNIVSGEVLYGRTKYDCSNGTLICTAPNQTMVYKGLTFSSEAYQIAFHKDYLNGHDLFDTIKTYNFFNYHVNEALHLSPKEEKLIKTLFKTIKTEYYNNQDEFTKEIILTHLEAILKYTDRFYKRQFLNRKEINKTLVTRLKSILNEYFDTNQVEEKGIPTVDWLANQLGVSYRYMNDTIKSETGKTVVDQINLFLVEEAKDMLLNPNLSISETAYKLGFEYPQYFTRVFKKKVGMSPKEYIKTHALN